MSFGYNSGVTIEEIEIKSALHRLHSKYLPYKWDLNVYRGCSHRCQYCYALYSHKYLNKGNFYETILVKKNIVEVLERQLASKRWKREVVNLGGVTDSYQEMEGKYELMPKILKLFIKYKTPITISTKSDLILRDKGLFEELAKVASVSVAVTVTTLDEKLQKIIEPGAVVSKRRLNVLREFGGKNIKLGLHMMPILPYLTDSEENLENIFREAAKIDIDYAICGILNLKSATRINYLDFIEKEFPSLFQKYLDLYNGAFCSKKYSRQVYEKIWRLKKKYKIRNNFKKNIFEKNMVKQLELL